MEKISIRGIDGIDQGSPSIVVGPICAMENFTSSYFSWLKVTARCSWSDDVVVVKLELRSLMDGVCLAATKHRKSSTSRLLPPQEFNHGSSTSLSVLLPSHKTFIIKKKLAKKQRQNRPIPHWIRLRTDNTIRYNAKRRHWRRTKLGF
ncbi:60S ribosomal protein L39 [Striga asiatica]|uniref:60S ribosomal protein L39 n=1 Tax=Striga asiatica TaxID=4170 RepID=A0A5A7QYI7_STRAF|nr:60S ribosomal protein L39 [Striga asiatica]